MEENKTLKVLRDALAKCHGHKETVALIYCDNEKVVNTEAFVGDSGKCAAAIHAMLDRVGEGRATPAECAITYAMLWGIAAADVTHNGALTEAIDGHKKHIMEEQQANKSGTTN
jgi:hypothetical protein